VLLSWKPGEFFLKSGYNEETTRLILDTVFRSQTWFSLDNGDITKEEAIDLMASKSSLKRDQIESLFNLCTEIIFPLHINIKLLPELKKQGFKLYYLSNFPREFFSEIKSLYEFFTFFDGGIISAEINHSKPDPEIYRIFLERYGLNAAECIYIDDIEINVRAAESVGMKGFLTLGSEDIYGELLRILD
jgi:putative hydrolase of the HAD superfamily